MTFLDDLESKNFFAPQPWWGATFRHLRLTSLKSCIRPCILFLINSFTFSIIRGKSTFNVFDSHSRDFEGFTSPNGTSVLLQFRSVHAVEKYILDAYISNANNIVQYEMQYVNIDTGEIEVNSLLRLYNKRRSQYRVGKCRSAIAASKYKIRRK